MKQFILKNKNALIGTVAILLIGVISMSFRSSLFSYDKYVAKENFTETKHIKDTLPDKDFKGSMKMKDFDKLQNELDRSMLQVNEEMKKIDLSAMQKEIEASLKTVDMEKIMKDVESSLKSIDLEKMMADISSSLKDVNLEIKSSEIEKAMQEAKKEIEKAKLEIKEVDREAIKRELEKAKLEIKKIKPEIDKIDMDKIMNEARAGIDKAKEELKLTREMFTEMEKDGLINSKEGFTVEYKDKNLYIDGKKQPEKITDKYRKYFKQEHFKMKIDKD